MTKKILVVEDDDAIRDGITLLLRDEGYQVEALENGQQALLYIKNTTQQPCLILLDMLMPVMSGFDFLDEVLKNHIPIPPTVVLTAYAGVKDLPGATRIVKKPIDLYELLAILKFYCEDCGTSH